MAGRRRRSELVTWLAAGGSLAVGGRPVRPQTDSQRWGEVPRWVGGRGLNGKEGGYK